ncbi:Hermansky-Pudlak syndrome 4 protein isoform X1 [Chiloscyllium plagiosum]|uniref:Hermansky-Pudlak syndrome 4 protein isoform X1 n=1 Tax=Chiloscyllium plagiosum TaxID=36176 RepID=UPI001CB7F470|nr:Hermansky-Pudlak syndrome 4 protein isoform X1 [Chiloscyllium plagiosum]
MATATDTEQKATTWCNYFFLYDTSKVKEEGDPTRAGIYYFFPSQTTLDQQELLCGQIAGVVCCISEISGSPPSLIHLRKLKFAIRLDGEYLWALGCSVEVPDVSCKRFLDQLVGIFTFYNGSSQHVYQVQKQEELTHQWDLHMEHIQQNSCDLHQIFTSLSNLDRTEVEPLLLLKAALILQTCQRCPEILAGCILYKNLIVSTQLPPAITAKILAYQPGVNSQNLPENTEDAPLPKDVTVLTVFVTEEESAALRQFAVEWMHGLAESPKPDLTDENIQKQPVSRTLPTSSNSEMNGEAECRDTTEFENPHSNSKDRDRPADSRDLAQNYKEERSIQPRSMEVDYKSSVSASSHPENEIPLSSTPEACSPPSNSCFTLQLEREQPNSISRDLYVELKESGNNENTERVTGPERISDSSDINASSRLTISDSSKVQLASEFENDEVPDQKEASVTPPLTSPIAVQTVPLQQHRNLLHGDAVLSQGTLLRDLSHPSPPTEYRKESAEIEQTVIFKNGCLGEPNHHGNLVKLNLYIHAVKGLVMFLLAEDGFRANRSAIEDVYHSVLASLNGLEVHLSETLLNRSFCNLLGYNFAHYDCIQHILTAQLSAGDQKGHFIRATALMHTDLDHNRSTREMIIRNASTAVYSCQNPAQETHFQILATPARNSGVPNPRDSAFALPGRAKQKLLKYGVNLL